MRITCVHEKGNIDSSQSCIVAYKTEEQGLVGGLCKSLQITNCNSAVSVRDYQHTITSSLPK